MSLISSGWSSFRITFSAVYWSASVWLEGNFAFLSAITANCLMHLFPVHSTFQLLMLFSAKNLLFAHILYLTTPF
jgi:hypothetical protein